MTDSYTITTTQSFTITHARHIAAKVATDLKRMQRFYLEPNDYDIGCYEEEVIMLLKYDYLDTIMYGFRKNGNWTEPMLRYNKRDFSWSSINSDDPGKIRPGADIEEASFYSYLIYSENWNRLSQDKKDEFNKHRPFSRSGAPAPSISGYLVQDRIYAAGGRGLSRQSLRSY